MERMSSPEQRRAALLAALRAWREEDEKEDAWAGTVPPLELEREQDVIPTVPISRDGWHAARERATPTRLVSLRSRRAVILLIALVVAALLAGLVIGTLLLGPWWFAQWHCLRGVPIDQPPREFAVCHLP